MFEISDDAYMLFEMAVVTTFIAIVMTTLVFFSSSAPRKVAVVELNIYPIKSCGPMKVESAKVTAIGFSFDRFAQVSDAEGNYLTPREKANARLFHVHPTIVNDKSGIHLRLAYSDSEQEPFRINDLNVEIEKSVVRKVTPMIGPKVRLQDLGDDVATWLSKATQIEDCRLTAIGSQYHRSVEMNPDQGEVVPLSERKKDIPPVSLADEAPFLLATSSSLDDLNARLMVRGKAEVGMQRFRPNIVVHGTFAWQEDTWKRIAIGGVEFRVWQRCGRCSMTTIDRETLERGSEPLATLSTFRERANGQRNFGMHMIPISNDATTEGIQKSVAVKVGDALEVLEYDEERLEEWKRLFGPP